MNRSEFIQKLRIALENDLSGSVVQENVDYYNDYILGEIRNGRRESEVLSELGDPWMIAHTVIDSVDNTGSGHANEASEKVHIAQNKSDKKSSYWFGLDTWWKKCLAIVVVLVAITAIVAIATGIISLVAPILLPIVIIVFIIRFFSRRR